MSKYWRDYFDRIIRETERRLAERKRGERA